MKELHLTRKDFRLEWFSGTGKGGQHRNKHRNCCRITHIESGLSAVGTESRSRITNRDRAFRTLAGRVIARYTERDPERRGRGDLIRTYHAVRNEVRDHETGVRMAFREMDLGPMIRARVRCR